VTEDEAARMLEGLLDWPRCIVIYPSEDGQKWRVRTFQIEYDRVGPILARVGGELMQPPIPLRHEPPKGIQ
jgi:hypothetical protein